MSGNINIVTIATIRRDILLLADLLEAHFVPANSVEQQHQAIELAKSLVKDDHFLSPNGQNELLSLFELLRDIKRSQLHTKSGFSWAEVVRKHIKELAKHYSQFMQDYREHYSSQHAIGNGFGFQHLGFDREMMMRRKRQQLYNQNPL